MLKTAIRCYETDDLCSVLPSVMLGLRSTYKDDIKATRAEMLFGASLLLPGDFFGSRSKKQNETEFVKNLRRTMSKVRLTMTSHHDKAKVFMQPSLLTSSHVFVRNDAVRTPLQQPYDGPYEVTDRRDKYFQVRINNRKVNISIDRLKTAFVFTDAAANDTCRSTTNDSPTPRSDSLKQETPSTFTTRSGRRVRLRVPV